MFATRADFEHPLPPGISSPDVKHWHAMALSMDLPWFLVVTDIEIKRGSFTQTTALAWERAVISLIESFPPEAVLSMHYMEPCERLTDGWSMRRIAELWLPSDEERDRTGPLLLRFTSKDGLYDCFGTDISGTDAARTLLLRICN